MRNHLLSRSARIAAATTLLFTCGLTAQSFEYVHGGVGYRCESTDDDVAWFSFEGGVILYTTDGGATIGNATVPEDVRGTLRGFHMAEDAQGPWGYCVGDGGVVLFSTDNGVTWTRKTDVVTPPTHMWNPGVKPQLWDVYFVDRDHGFVVGFEHTIQETTNGGQSWIDLAPPSGHVASDNPEWYQIHVFANGDFVTVADNGWYLHRTAATGSVIANEIDPSAWCYLPDQAGPSPWNLEIWGVDFVGDDGIAVGGVVHQDGYVFRSTDAGKTWALDSACYAHLLPGTAGLSPPTLYDVDLFGDPDGGVIVGYGSYTALGGTSASSTAVLACTTCTSSSKAWIQVVGDSDQNGTQDPEDDDAAPLLRGVCSSDSFDVGYVVGDFGTIRRTDNRGQTWTELAGLHRGRIECGAFADADVGVAAGQFWRVFGTVDGGESFQIEYAENPPIEPGTNPPAPYHGWFNDGAIAAAGDRAVVVGDHGRVAVRDAANVWHSRPIGSWGAAPRLRAALTDASGLLMLVAGEAYQGNTLHLSIDGGATAFVPLQLTWQGNPVTTTIVDLGFDGTYVYYLAENDLVYVVNPAVSLTAALAAVPIVGSTGTPTCLGVRSLTDFYAADDKGEVFRIDVGSATMQKVTAILATDLGRKAMSICPVPGSADWWFTGDHGRVVRWDGTAKATPKSTMQDAAVDASFFAGGGGVVIGRKINVAKWTP